MSDDKLPSPTGPVQTTVSVGDLIRMCQKAANARSKTKHRLLLMNCAYALQQLVQRLDTYENPRSQM